jgi:hypothetical protein
MRRAGLPTVKPTSTRRTSQLTPDSKNNLLKGESEVFGTVQIQYRYPVPAFTVTPKPKLKNGTTGT